MKSFSIIILQLFLWSGSLSALSPEELMGKWAVSGSQYTYLYSFDISGAAEKRIVLGSDTVVWTGTGTFSIRGELLTIHLDKTAGNTPVTEIFSIAPEKNGSLTLQGKSSYFSDIARKTVTMVRLPD